MAANRPIPWSWNTHANACSPGRSRPTTPVSSHAYTDWLCTRRPCEPSAFRQTPRRLPARVTYTRGRRSAVADRSPFALRADLRGVDGDSVNRPVSRAAIDAEVGESDA